MDLDPRTLALIKQRLDEAERNIQHVRHVLDEPNGNHAQSGSSYELPPLKESGRVIEGVFDGKNMQGNDGEEYPVPPNYASKSRLVEGDVLKLTIGTDGSFVYKQIRPIDRRRVVGTLVLGEEQQYGVQTEEKLYHVLLASVTFYKAEEGDEITILLPVHGEAAWGAIENVMHRSKQPVDE